MARGEPPGRQFTKSRPTATTLKSRDTSGLSGRERAAIQRANNNARISSGRNLETIASDLLNFIGDRDLIKAAMDGEINPALAGGLIAAGMVPIPGPKVAAKAVGKTVSKAKKGKKAPVGESGLTQTIGDAVGEPGQRVANEAVGRKTPKGATGSKEVRAPKDKPTANPPRREDYAHASSHSRAVSNWQKKVDAWNKSNPENQVAQATPDRLTPGQGRAATDTERQVKKAEADKSPEEKKAVARGERKASKARREQQVAEAREDTGVADITRERTGKFIDSRAERMGMKQAGGGKKPGRETKIDDILATMRQQLDARDRTPGAPDTMRLDESGMLTPYSDPDRFTRPTMIEQQRAEAQAARYEAATGRSFPPSDDRVRREGMKPGEGFARPAADSVEGRLQAQAKAEDLRADADTKRTEQLMDSNRPTGAPRSTERAPDYPKGPDEGRRSMTAPDSAYAGYSRPQPSRVTTPSLAEQNVRIGRAEGTVVPGRMTTPQPDLSGMPRGVPVMGRGERGSQPMRSFESMTEKDYAAQGLFPVERMQLDDNGNPVIFTEYLRVDPDVYIGGPDTPPSLKMSRPNYQGFGQGGPAATKVVPEKVATPQPPDGGNPRLFVTKEEIEARTATTGAEGPKKGKEPKKQQQPQSGDRSPEAVRARTYEGYRELERQGILNPGDADRIMSGGTGAQKVFEETPTQEQRNKGIKPGKATREDNQRKATREDNQQQQAKGKADQPGSMSAAQMAERLKMPKGFTAASGTFGLAGYGFISAGGQENNDRPVIIPGEAYDTKNAFRPTSRTPTSRTPDRPKQGFLKDKYGRKITREEFDRRKAFRAKRERLKGQVPGEILRQITEKEMKRRKRFRGNFGDRSAYNVATRNIGGGGTQTRVLDTDARKRLSGAFRG